MKLIEYAFHPLQTHRWLQFLKGAPELDKLLKAAPQLATRIHKPYLSPQLSCAQRADVLVDHYEIVAKSRFAEFIQKAAQRPIVLHQFSGRSGDTYQLTLAAVDSRQRDGELALRLLCRDSCVYTASFLFVYDDQGATQIKIGGLHGLLATDNQLRIKRVTRDLHGCRPKDLMVAAVREIGHCFDCEKTLLIGNRNKMPPASAHVCKKSSDYDATWKEMQAVERADGDFELPCKMPAATCVAGDIPLCVTPKQRLLLVENVLQAVRIRLLSEKRTARFRFPARAPVAVEQELVR